MGSILIIVRDLEDHQLVFDGETTKKILGFFWPSERASINGLEQVTTDARRLAQTALMGAIEGSIAMGILAIVAEAALGRRVTNVAEWGRQLAKDLGGYAWKHARPQDLRKAEVYHSIRDSIAGSLREHLHSVTGQVAARPIGQFQFFAYLQPARKVA